MDSLVLLILGGVIGFISTLAGGGYFLALPVLVALGFSLPVAYGGLWGAVFVSCVTRLIIFSRAGVIDWLNGITLSIPITLGTFAGAMIRPHFPEADTDAALLGAAVFSLTLIAGSFRHFFASRNNEIAHFGFIELTVFFLIGGWAGVTAIESPALLIWALMVLVGYDVVRANALKGLLSLVTTVVTVIILGSAGHAAWSLDILLAAGALIGSRTGAHVAIHEEARIWVFPIIVVALTADLIWLIAQALMR